MARIRYIKPGFFSNERLAEHGPSHRLLFAGLWTIADKSGRLEDRPKRIKAELFPYDDLTAEQVDQMLSDLASGDDPFIARYEVGGAKCIVIPKWPIHQRPHKHERDSVLPPPRNAKRTEQITPVVTNDAPSTTKVHRQPGQDAALPALNGEWNGELERGTGIGDGAPKHDTPAGASEVLPGQLLRSGSLGSSPTLITSREQRKHGEHLHPGACTVGACVLPGLHADFTNALSVSEGFGPDGRTLRQFYDDEVAAIRTSKKPVGDTWAHWRSAFGRWVGVAPRAVPPPSTKASRTMAAGDSLQAKLDAGAVLDPFGTKRIRAERAAHEQRLIEAAKAGA